MNRGNIVKEINNIIEKGILKPGEFWLSNRSALVMYGIKDNISYLAINCRKDVFDALLKRTDYVARIERKKRILDIKSNILLYEDNRPCRFGSIEGIKVETIYSILSKKLFYCNNEKDVKEVQEIEEYIRANKSGTDDR